MVCKYHQYYHYHSTTTTTNQHHCDYPTPPPRRTHRALRSPKTTQWPRVCPILIPHDDERVARKLDDISTMLRQQSDLSIKVLVENTGEMLDADASLLAEFCAEWRKARYVDEEKTMCLVERVIDCEAKSLVIVKRRSGKSMVVSQKTHFKRE